MAIYSLPSFCFFFFINHYSSSFAGNLHSPHTHFEIVAGLNPDSVRGSMSTQKQIFGFGFQYLIANVVILVLTLVNIVVYKLLERQDENSDSDQKSSSSVNLNVSSEKHLCRRFSLDEIVLATDNFDELLVIGKGGFGKVYKVMIDNGSCTVAIKRLNSLSKQGSTEFGAEIKMLPKFRHSHLVSLIGYCDQSSEMILVYDFMVHGSLDNHLHKIGKNGKSIILSWVQRLKICIGAARGLDYLHTGIAVVERVIHRDVKSSNILLDENWAAKISDFGLSRIGPADQESTHVSTRHIQGTLGYMDPEYFYTLRFTRKTDVYAFGVLLLEVLSERAAVDRSLLDEEQWSLAMWGQHCINEGTPHKLIGPNVDWEILPNSLAEFVQIAGQCLHRHPNKRPTMSEVVAKLQLALSLQLRTNEIMDDDLPVSFLYENPDGKSSSNDDGGHIIEDMRPAISGKIVIPNLNIYEFSELDSATKNFTLDVLGKGSFGCVYKGWVDETTLVLAEVGHGKPVAIKRLRRDGLWGPEEGLMEVEILGKFSHPNLVRLLGYCHGGDDHEFLLVYEYMQNRSLDRFFLAEAKETLSWYTRLKIAIGTARALSFLHTTPDNQITHRGVKTSHILLDEGFNAKLSGFGFAKRHPLFETQMISTRVTGTHGYVAPEYLFITGDLYIKSDVYSFGVVLLEILTGLRMFNMNGQSDTHNLVDWAKPFLSKKRAIKMKLADPRLENNYPPKGAFELASLILKCLEPYPQHRPSMNQVLQSLEQIYSIKLELKEGQADTSKSLWSWTRNLRKTSS